MEFILLRDYVQFDTRRVEVLIMSIGSEDDLAQDFLSWAMSALFRQGERYFASSL